MLICHEWKLVFLHVPKCAGTAVRAILKSRAPLGSTVSFFDFEYNHTLKRYVDLAHLPLMDLRHYDVWPLINNYHTMAAIRHPYARMASACREFYRQSSRETEIQMRSQPPSKDQLLFYLRSLPAALDAHDLRYVHAFPIVWFTHYGSDPMVDILLRCNHLGEDLEQMRPRRLLPENVLQALLDLAADPPDRQGSSLAELEADPDLQAMTNLLHHEDFNTYGFHRADARLFDEALKSIVEPSLSTTASHQIPCLGLAPSMRWYWGRDSKRIPPTLNVIRPCNRPSEH